jgi:multisubunit Na+/H+ antiporter MnhG subunit
MLGLAVAGGVNLVSLKLLLIVFLFWFASPVASHLIGRLELETNEELEREVKLWKR